MTTAQARHQRRRQHAPDAEPAIVAGRSFTFSWGRTETGRHTFAVNSRSLGGPTGGGRHSRKRVSAKGSARHLAGETARHRGTNRRERRPAKNRVRNPRHAQARATRLTIAKAARHTAAAAAKPFRSAWSGIRHLRKSARPRNERERIEVNRFTYIGRVGLVPGIIGTAVGLATHNANIGLVVGYGLAVFNSRLQGHVSMWLNRKGDSGMDVDRRQNNQIDDLRKEVGELRRQVEQLKADGSTPQPTTRGRQSGKQSTGKRHAGDRARTGEGTGKDRSGKQAAKNTQPREPQHRPRGGRAR